MNISGKSTAHSGSQRTSWRTSTLALVLVLTASQSAVAVTVTEVGDSFLGQPGSINSYLTVPSEKGNNTYSGSIGGFNSPVWDRTDNLQIDLPSINSAFISGFFQNLGGSGIALNFSSPALSTVTVAGGNTWNFTAPYLAAWTADKTPRILMFDYQGSSSFTKTPYTLGLSVFVPEPGVLGLLGIGLFGLGLTRRKRMT